MLKTILLGGALITQLMIAPSVQEAEQFTTNFEGTNLFNDFNSEMKKNDEWLDSPVEEFRPESSFKKHITFTPIETKQQTFTFFINHDGPNIKANKLITTNVINTSEDDKVGYKIIQMDNNFAVMFYEKSNSFKTQEEFNRYLNDNILKKYSKFELKIGDRNFITNRLVATTIGNKGNYTATNKIIMTNPLLPSGVEDLKVDPVTYDVRSDNKSVDFIFKNNNTEKMTPSVLVFYLIDEETGAIVGDSDEKRIIIKEGQEVYSLSYDNLKSFHKYSLTYYVSSIGNEHRYSELNTIYFETIKR